MSGRRAYAAAAVALAACGGAPAGGRPPAAKVAAADAAASAGRGKGPFELAVGTAVTCVRDGGRVFCGPSGEPAAPLVGAEPFGDIVDAESLSLSRGGDFGCVVRKGGALACFGNNQHGQLGAGLSDPGSRRPVAVAGVRGARRVIAGDDRACALLDDGGVRCWGANVHGETGGSVSYEPAVRDLVAPVAVDEAKGAFALALGAKTTCALVGAGEVRCWGAPFGPEKWDNGTAGGRPPWRLPGATAFRDLAAHDRAFCGVARGEVFCWGELGYLVAGEATYAEAPVRIEGLAGVERVRVGPQRACALHAGGRVSCWGFEAQGTLGRDSPADFFGTLGPAPVVGLPPAVDVGFGESITCALTSSRDVYCWGRWLTAEGNDGVASRPRKMRIFP